MGAIFFYIFIFFAGYYGANVLNMLTVRPFITNRYIAALFPVYGIAIAHAYMIATRPLPPGKGVTVESALLEFIVLPIVVVTMGAVYFMWNSKGSQETYDTGPRHSVSGEADESSDEKPDGQSNKIQPEANPTAEKKEEAKQ